VRGDRAVFQTSGEDWDKGGKKDGCAICKMWEGNRAEKVFAAVEEVSLRVAEKGLLSMVVTFSNACPI